MSLPTAAEVTNMALFNEVTTPSSEQLASDKWICPNSEVRRMTVAASDYMTGPGRFAFASMSSLVRKFFSVLSDLSDVVAGQSYTKAEMAKLLGMPSDANYGISFQQYSYDDGAGDYGYLRIQSWRWPRHD